jgi:hypothetical protein
LEQHETRVPDLEDHIAARIGAAQALEPVAGLLQAALALGVIDGRAGPIGPAGRVEPDAQHEAFVHFHGKRSPEDIEPNAVVCDQHRDGSLEPID